MAGEVSPREAITQLASSTGEAVARVLDTFLPGGVERSSVTVIGERQNPFAALPLGGVAASVRYVDGVSGANVFIMSAEGARALASAMGAAEKDEGALTAFELSAIGEAANQMLASAAAAISVVIGQEIDISPPEVRVIDERLDPVDAWGTAPHACVSSLYLAGQSCRLVQLIPSAFVVRMARAIDDLGMASVSGADSNATPPDDIGTQTMPLSERMVNVGVRVWAELGRTDLPIGTALSLPSGAIIDLDRTVDAPVELFVNGLCFGEGRLLVSDDGEWAIEVTSIHKPSIRKPALVGGVGVVDRASAALLTTSKGAP
ncbi:MAG: FliM/FliN family flagellar motor switch protein [Solirubrobacteraceae bacterium]